MTTRQKYELIKFVMETDGMCIEKKLNIAKPFKKEIRQCMKPLNTDPFSETYHYRDEYGESFYIKEFFKYPFTEKDKEEFIEDQWQHIYSPYDCTAMRFTKSIRIFNFKEPNSFGARSVVYHFMGLDV